MSQGKYWVSRVLGPQLFMKKSYYLCLFLYCSPCYCDVSSENKG